MLINQTQNEHDEILNCIKKACKKLLLFMAYSFFLFISASFISQAEWRHDSAGWYYIKADGRLAINGFERIDGEWYYFDANGYMKTGWVQSAVSWHYFDADGRLARNRWIGDYYVDAYGDMMTNAVTPDGYYVGADGKYNPNSSRGTIIPEADKAIALELESKRKTIVYDNEVSSGTAMIPTYQGRLATLITSKGRIEDIGDAYLVHDTYLCESSDMPFFGPFDLYVRKSATVYTGGRVTETAESLYKRNHSSLFLGYQVSDDSFDSFGEYTTFDPAGFVTHFSAYIGD